MPDRVSEPVPFLLMLLPLMFEEMVAAEEPFTVMFDKLPIEPPESAMLPEPDAKMRDATFRLPETVMVPAPRPVAPLPKLTVSLPVVVMLVPGVPDPSVLVVH